MDSVPRRSRSRSRRRPSQSEVAGFGAIEKITFQRVGPGGADIYSVKSAKGAWEFRIWLTEDGKVEQANTRAVQ